MAYHRADENVLETQSDGSTDALAKIFSVVTDFLGCWLHLLVGCITDKPPRHDVPIVLVFPWLLVSWHGP